MVVHHGIVVDRLTSSSSLNSSVFSAECNGTPVTRVVSIFLFLKARVGLVFEIRLL